jgi:hypothetical protein
MHWFFASWHWWLVHSGTSELTPNVWYNAWSGWVSDLGEVTLVGAVVVGYRHANCHIQGCWRLAKHEYEMDGVKYRLCRVHHPKVDERPTAKDFDAHHAAMVAKPKRATRSGLGPKGVTDARGGQSRA